MPVFDECCVLIPAATLEDFPSDLSDSDARSLLAAWTVLWHPGLLAQTEQTPIWYRADSPPDPVGKRLITVPAPSKPELPSGYEARAQVSEGCLWVTGASRKEMLETIDGALDSAPIGTLTANGRQIGIEDFFAAGFAALQVQVMTRRLRYTSNLDEIHLQNRIVAAAKAFLAGSAEEAIAALHDVFDCLAEERDHYFSSDPHLIDLTLTSESTMESLIRSIDSKLSQSGDEESIATPMNVLIDWDVAQAIGRSGTEAQSLKSAIADNQIGWAGGGPSSDACLDTMSLSEAEALFVDAHRTTTEAVGSAPEVFARFSGSTPADMTPTLTKLGYCGMIPLDFAAGTGHGDEAKVIMQSAGAEMEALTAKPMDAASDASFLTLGPQLGEAIDSGEIATALMAHWPEQGCDSFHDLLKVSSWSLCLGRFWKLNDYFKDGEHPYHHGSATISSASSAQLLTTLVAQNASDPIATLAENFRSSVTAEHQRLTSAMTRLVSRDPNRDSADPASDFAAAVTGSTSDAKQSPDASKILINPHAIGARTSVTLATAPKDVKHVFASSSSGNGNETTVDIPAYGFVILKPSGRTGDPRVSFSQRVKDKFLGAPQSMAESGRLHNEFMDVTISDESGGISGVYSGSLRGNRFSLRLVSNGHVASDKTKKTDKTKKKDQSGKSDNPDASESKMVCQKVTVVESTAALGCIESTGKVLDDKGVALANFTLRYTLRRGSRVIEVEGDLDPIRTLGDKPWKDNFAARVAVSDEGAIYRALVRDKVHRSRSRRIVAPLGVLIDETERQTLVGSAGSAFHYRLGDRFLDTLVCVKGESKGKIHLYYGFDVTSPIAFARTLIQPPTESPVTAKPELPEIGWIVHTAPKDIVISDLQVHVRDDGKLAAIVRLIQTRPQPCKASLRFLHNVQAAFLSETSSDLNRELPKEKQANEEESRTDSNWLKTEGDSVKLSMPGHGVVDLIAIFE